MYAVHLSYSLIKPSDRVLDIGGSASPFRRANAVLDFLPYEKRNRNPLFLSALPEQFSKDTWFVQDVCDRSKPFPFRDQEFDFVNCGHLLEDVRDPFYVISEVLRISKRGYFEVPSRFAEQMLWAEKRKICGYSHHRWIIDPRKNPKTQKWELSFIFKNQTLHGDPRLQVRAPWHHLARPKMSTPFQFQGFYFNGGFDAYEDVNQAIDNGESFMLETVKQAQTLGRKLWDTTTPAPVKIENFENLPSGLHPLSSLEQKISRRMNYFDPRTGRPTDSILEFEKEFEKTL